MSVSFLKVAMSTSALCLLGLHSGGKFTGQEYGACFSALASDIAEAPKLELGGSGLFKMAVTKFHFSALPIAAVGLNMIYRHGMLNLNIVGVIQTMTFALFLVNEHTTHTHKT